MFKWKQIIIKMEQNVQIWIIITHTHKLILVQITLQMIEYNNVYLIINIIVCIDKTILDII